MPRASDYLPAREALLVTWSNNFETRTTATPTAFGLSVVQAAAFATLNQVWVAAYNVANSDLTNSRAATLDKNNAKKAMIANARILAKIVRGFPGILDSQLADLGLTVPKPGPTPAPIPDTSPMIKVVSSANRVVTLNLLDSTNERRAKPSRVSIAYVFSHIGATPPEDIASWDFQGSTSRSEVKVAYGADTPANAQVWFTACWLNARQQPGLLCAPVTTNIAGGVSSAEPTMKIAA